MSERYQMIKSPIQNDNQMVQYYHYSYDEFMTDYSYSIEHNQITSIRVQNNRTFYMDELLKDEYKTGKKDLFFALRLWFMSPNNDGIEKIHFTRFIILNESDFSLLQKDHFFKVE